MTSSLLAATLITSSTHFRSETAQNHPRCSHHAFNRRRHRTYCGIRDHITLVCGDSLLLLRLMMHDTYIEMFVFPGARHILQDCRRKQYQRRFLRSNLQIQMALVQPSETPGVGNHHRRSRRVTGFLRVLVLRSQRD